MISSWFQFSTFGERVVKDPQETCQGTQSHPNHPNLILFRARAQATVPQAGRKINQRYVSRCQQVINKNKHNISRLTESRDSTHYFSSFDPMQGRNSPRGAEIQDSELNHLETEMTGNDMICYFVFHETGKFHENVSVFKEHLWKMLGNDYEMTMNEPKWKVRNSRDNIGYIRCSKTALGLTQHTRQLDNLTAWHRKPRKPRKPRKVRELKLRKPKLKLREQHGRASTRRH